MAHTPGPWMLGPFDSGPHEVFGHPVVNAEGLILAMASNNDEDARLIAAAPDLLAALEKLQHIAGKMKGFRNHGVSVEMVEHVAHAAIAKALGSPGPASLPVTEKG